MMMVMRYHLEVVGQDRFKRQRTWDEIYIFLYDLLYLTYFANFYGFDVVVSCCKVDSVTIFM